MSDDDAKLMTQTYGDITVGHFLEASILDDQTIKDVAEELLELGDNSYQLKLVLNFSNVEYLSSAVLGKLVKLRKKIKEGNGGLKLCGIKPEIMEVFEITQLDSVFDIRDSQDEAIKAFKNERLSSG